MSTSDLLAQNTSPALNSAHASAAGEGPRPPPEAPSTSFPLLSRTRAAAAEDGEADVVLSLGEFSSVPTLSHSEVKYLLNTLRETRRSDASGGKVNESDCLTKTMDYLGSFARYKTREQILAVERAICSGYQERFEGFERSQLGESTPIAVQVLQLRRRLRTGD